MKLAVALLVSSLALGCGASPPARRSPVSAPEPAGGGVEPDAIDEGLALPEERFVVGERFTIVGELSIKSVIELNAVDRIRYDGNTDKETIVEVLEVDTQGRLIRSRTTFAIDDVRYILGRKVEHDPSPIAGKTYLITHSADPIQVTDHDGATPSKAEVAAVRAAITESDGDKARERMFAKVRWHTDQRVELSSEALAVVNRGQRDQRTRYTSFAQELRSSGDRTASFFVTLRFEQGTNNGPIVLELTGTKEVDITTGRTLSMMLRGPVTGYLGAPVRGEATMSFRIE